MTESFSPKSSFLTLCSYDETAKTLEITFKNGTVYRYLYVFKPMFDAFKLSNDHGRHYTTQLKGKLRSVPIVSKSIGHKKSTPLIANKLKRGLHDNRNKHGLTYGLTRIFKSAGLIPSQLTARGGKGSAKGIAG